MNFTNKMSTILLISIALILSAQCVEQLDFSKNITPDMENYIGYKLNFELYNGYVPVTNNENESLFYTMVTKTGETLQNMSRDTPVIIWLEGGPGCSGQFELYNQLGPFKVQKKPNSSKFDINLRDISWNQQALLVILEQPLRTGLSHTEETVVTSTPQAAENFKTFLQKFYTQYSGLEYNPTYIFGYSYGGHYVPNFSNMVLKDKPVQNLNFQGIGIGDGLVNAQVQISESANFGYNAAIFGQYRKNIVEQIQEETHKSIDAGNYVNGTSGFNWINYVPYPIDIYNIFHYDLDGQRDPSYDQETYSDLLNDKEFRKVYGIPDIIGKYEECDQKVYNDFFADISMSYQSDLEDVLNSGIKVILYQGQIDYIVTSPGQQTFVNSMNWQGAEKWQNANRKVWYFKDSDRHVIGNYQVSSNLAYANFYKAGHVIGSDQPLGFYQMLQKYLNWDW